MTPTTANKFAHLITMLVLVALFRTATLAATTKVEGVIIGRSGNEIIVEYLQGAELAFLLDDTTKVSQTGGLFKARRTDKSMAALIPGLKVKVEGDYNQDRKLVATSVKFSGGDLEKAQLSEAASRQHRKETEQHKAELEKQAAALKVQNEQLQLHEEQLAAHKAQIEAAVARFGDMDDYYIMDEVTVYFGNGKINVDPKYEAPLLQLASKAKDVDGYVIEVTGYASSAGSTEVNQKLSQDRANNVTNVLLQKGNVPLTRILAPGAMGESRQVSNDKSADAQADNRRVVVRVLQNKAIAGI
ncbi:MAG TPA: OmpA family protein [Candidatus Sulfotelmatobacter sp.]|nr:OmpA family protein [Candidatus Sulfotelmatobacter sp.]